MTIITPNIAIFKEGKLWVYTLPEEPEYCGMTSIIDMPAGTKDFLKRKYQSDLSYARDHPFKVQEKDKEKVKRLIWHNELKLKKTLLHLHDWKHTDLTEYSVEGLKFEVIWGCKKCGAYESTKSIPCQNSFCEKYKLACLIEDDKPIINYHGGDVTKEQVVEAYNKIRPLEDDKQ